MDEKNINISLNININANTKTNIKVADEEKKENKYGESHLCTSKISNSSEEDFKNIKKDDEIIICGRVIKIPFLIFISSIVFAVAILSSRLGFSFSKVVFFTVASLSICIYARFAFEIHDLVPKETKIIEVVVKDGQSAKKEFKRSSWYIYNQYWFNGLGAFIGWVALYVLLFYRIEIDIEHSHSYWVYFFKNIKLQDFIVMLVAFFGITGYFPYAALIGKLKP